MDLKAEIKSLERKRNKAVSALETLQGQIAEHKTTVKILNSALAALGSETKPKTHGKRSGKVGRPKGYKMTASQKRAIAAAKRRAKREREAKAKAQKAKAAKAKSETVVS